MQSTPIGVPAHESWPMFHPLSARVAIPFTATEVRRSRALVGTRNQERSETMDSLAAYPT
jgi:hypothetical protein